MKILTAPLFLFALISTSCIKTSGNNGKDGEQGFSFSMNGNQGKGPVKDKTVTGLFTGVDVSNSLQVEIHKSLENKVVLSAPDDILEFIEAKIQTDGTVKIGIVSNSRKNISTNKVRVTVYTKQLKNIEVSSSSVVTIADKFIEDLINIDVNSSAILTGNLEANKIALVVDSSSEFKGEIIAQTADIDINSSGRAQLQGKIQYAKISVSSSAELAGDDLDIVNGTVDASSSANFSSSVSGNVTAEASSSASVTLKNTGKAVVKQSSSSSGRVTIL